MLCCFTFSHRQLRVVFCLREKPKGSSSTNQEVKMVNKRAFRREVLRNLNNKALISSVLSVYLIQVHFLLFAFTSKALVLQPPFTSSNHSIFYGLHQAPILPRLSAFADNIYVFRNPIEDFDSCII